MKRIQCVALTIAALVVCGYVGGVDAADTADASAEDLRPLRYNDPDLVVDLGVGLWAFPMPIDYDGDGDLDLMVGCPDKPSAGVFLFNNPGVNASDDPADLDDPMASAMPVFDPGRKIGPARQYMTINRVGDQAIVLAKNMAFYRRTDGTFDFTERKKIYDDSLINPDRKMRPRGQFYRFVDEDGDGDHDIIIGYGDWSDLGWDHAYDDRGVWRNGPLHGYVFRVENVGDDDAPRYAPPEKIHADGEPIDVYGWPCPNFADFDGDGDLDLMCGEFMDGLSYFQNVGTRRSPRYAAAVRVRDPSGDDVRMHVQMITPTAVDWDADGHVDLIVGDEDGRVAWVRHTGGYDDGTPIFDPPRYFKQRADTLKFGALATPAIYDWDGDGDNDIVCGNTSGNIAWFENRGGSGADTVWAAPVRLMVRNGDGLRPFRVMAGVNGSIQGPCEAKWGYTTLSVADVDGDGDGDIVYNSILARVAMLRNDGDHVTEVDLPGNRDPESPPAWYGFRDPSRDALSPWRTTPVAIDWDGDGELDLVSLDQAGYLTLRRGFGDAERIFVDADGRPWCFNTGTAGRSGRVKLAVVDWDDDGDFDVLVNSANATLYENVRRRNDDAGTSPVVLVPRGNLARRNVAGHTSSPAAGDLDGDGKPDLVVGSENGRLYFLSHDQCVAPEGVADDVTAGVPVKQLAIAGGGRWGLPVSSERFDPASITTTRGPIAAWSDGKSVRAAFHDGLRWNPPMLIDRCDNRSDGRRDDPALSKPALTRPVLIQEPGDGPVTLRYEVWVDGSVRQRERTSFDRGRSYR